MGGNVGNGSTASGDDGSLQRRLEKLVTDAKLTEVDGKTEKGLCTVPLTSLMSLLTSASKRENAPKAVSILSMDIEGRTTNSHHAKFKIAFNILVLRSSWSSTRLLSSRVALISSAIERNGSSIAAADNHSQTNSLATSGSEPHGTVAEQEPAVAVLDDYYSFLCKSVGNYTVTMEVLAPYTTSRETGVKIEIPYCPRSELRFTVEQSDVDITVEPCLKNELRRVSNSTCATCLIPPSKSGLNIQWIRKLEEEIETQAADAASIVKKKADPLPLHATVEQQHLISVGDKVLTIASQFEYSINNGSMSLFEISLDADLKVLNVETTDGNIKRWDVSPLAIEADSLIAPNSSSASSSTAAVTAASPAGAGITDEKKTGNTRVSMRPRQLLKIILEYGLETTFTIKVTLEKELESTSCQFFCPTFRHIRGPVTREKGFIGIEARSNVEVDQIDLAKGVTPLDVTEMPEKLRKMASNPLLLSYKFLIPLYEIELQVKKHDDVDVLVAAVDAAHFIATYTEEGRTIYKLIMRVRNTQKQYLRLLIPSDCDIWSTVVSNRPCKPARDNTTGEIMIPLEKQSVRASSASSSTSSSHASFFVELVYVRQPSLEVANQIRDSNSGILNFSFPAVDLPLNHLGMSLWVPEDYVYGEFAGDAKEVANFSVSMPAPPASNTRGGLDSDDEDDSRTSFMLAPQAPPNVLSRRDSASSISFSKQVKSLPSSKFRNNKKTGVVPVRVEMVTDGKHFMFERLLVVKQDIKLNVSYRKQEKGYFKKRHVKTCCC